MTTFDGATYQPERPDDPGSDHDRLAKQMKAVWEHMTEHNYHTTERWHTLRCIADYVGASEASVSARLRDFRKAKNGGHLVERRYVRRGLFEYRLTPNTKRGAHL